MRAPLTLRTVAPIYALSGFPHPDKPQITAGKAAVIVAENARFPPSGPAPPAFPPAGGASVSDPVWHGTDSFLFRTYGLKPRLKGLGCDQKFARKSYDR